MYPGDGFDTKAAKQFAAYRGRPLDVVTVFLDWRKWNDIIYSGWAFERYAGFRVRMAVALPLTVSGTPLDAVANGSHDAAFRRFAQILLANGRGNADIRLGWEFNRPGYPWAAYRGNGYLRAFQHVSTLLKRLLPQATIDWNGGWGTTKNGLDPLTQFYPGDAYVDVVSMDAYDHGIVRADTRTAFQAWATAPLGLDAWARFAAAHHKGFAVPEWGVTADGGGDNPAFITGMFQWFRNHADHLVYEAYFNEPDGHTRNSLSDPVEMPLSSATYRKLWARP